MKNVLFIIGEGIDYLPNIHGITQKAIAGGGMCTPSRFVIMTGREPPFDDTSWFNIPATIQGDKLVNTTIANDFRNMGYNTALIGKFDTGAVTTWNHGFDTHTGIIGRSVSINYETNDNTSWIGSHGNVSPAEMLQTKAILAMQIEPFFVIYSPIDTHPKYTSSNISSFKYWYDVIYIAKNKNALIIMTMDHNKLYKFNCNGSNVDIAFWWPKVPYIHIKSMFSHIHLRKFISKMANATDLLHTFKYENKQQLYIKPYYINQDRKLSRCD